MENLSAKRSTIILLSLSSRIGLYFMLRDVNSTSLFFLPKVRSSFNCVQTHTTALIRTFISNSLFSLLS